MALHLFLVSLHSLVNEGFAPVIKEPEHVIGESEDEDEPKVVSEP